MNTLSNCGGRLARLATIAALAAFTGSLAASAGTVYPVNTTITSAVPTGNPLQSDSVVGSITTDGTIGVIQTSDILDYNLDLIDNLNAANDYDLTPADSTIVEDYGNAFTASASGLFFDYSGSGEFLIQADNPGPYSGYRYFCFSTGGACYAGETIAPNDVFTDGAVLTGSSAPVGNQPLGPSTTTPEPTSLLLLATGFGGLLTMARGRLGLRGARARF